MNSKQTIEGRGDMPRKKEAKPQCPAPDCQGGYSNRIHEADYLVEKTPADVLERKDRNDTIFRCNYCGFLWAKSSSKGYDGGIIPLGFYDSFQNPNEFSAVPKTYRIRREL